MWGFLNEIAQAVGAVLAIGGFSAAAAYGLFRVFATKWIEARFSEQLEVFKYKQNQELEHLRFRINTQFDRMVKLHQHEFDVLPQIWALANSAYRNVFSLTSGFRMDVDLDRMGTAQFKEFVDACRLVSWEKDELLKMEDDERDTIGIIYSGKN